jgi:hypothetical protein
MGFMWVRQDRYEDPWGSSHQQVLNWACAQQMIVLHVRDRLKYNCHFSTDTSFFLKTRKRYSGIVKLKTAVGAEGSVAVDMVERRVFGGSESISFFVQSKAWLKKQAYVALALSLHNKNKQERQLTH